MPTEFLMPKLGLTMEEGRIVSWLVADGAAVQVGTPVLHIETDKVESDVESPAAGRLHHTGAPGESFACGAVIGFLLADDEGPPDTTTEPSRQFVSPNARRVAFELGVDLTGVRGTGPDGRIVSEDVEEVAARVTTTDTAPRHIPPGLPTADSYVPATFAARQLAELLGLDLRAVPADPADGRVTRETVALHVRQRLRPITDAVPPVTAMRLAQTPTEVRTLTGTRGTIAKRMHASLHEMAQLTLMMDAELDAVIADRATRQASGNAPGFTDYVVAATARALREHPIVNAQVTENGIALLPDIHIGLAVAVPTGLMVPVVRHADRLGLADLSAETSRLAVAGRAGALKLPDLEGGTFSVSALGMFGVDGFTPVINPPNVAILGVGRIRDDVVLQDGEITTSKRLTLSLTWDHRVLDGAPAAAFCQTIVKHLAAPNGLG